MSPIPFLRFNLILDWEWTLGGHQIWSLPTRDESWNTALTVHFISSSIPEHEFYDFEVNLKSRDVYDQNWLILYDSRKWMTYSCFDFFSAHLV